MSVTFGGRLPIGGGIARLSHSYYEISNHFQWMYKFTQYFLQYSAIGTVVSLSEVTENLIGIIVRFPASKYMLH